MLPLSSSQKRRALLSKVKTRNTRSSIPAKGGHVNIIAQEFAPVQLKDMPAQDSRIEVYFPSGVHIAIKGDTDLSKLFELINPAL